MSRPGKPFWFVVSAALSFALLPAALLAADKDGISPLPSGMYQISVFDVEGQIELSCGRMRGTADATVQGRSVLTPMFDSLEFGINGDGDVSGQGAETLSGFNMTTYFQGKQTSFGYSGDLRMRFSGVGCTGNWTLTRGVPPESGTYTLTVRDQTRSEKLSCKRLEGIDELDIDEGRGSPGIFAGLRITVFPNGSLYARGFETALYSMPAILTGKKSADGYQGEYFTDKLGYRCVGTWSLVRRN